MPEILLPRRTESIATAADFVEQQARREGWAESDVSRLVLATGEVASNAVEHGRGTSFSLGCACDGSLCRVTVGDDGPGPGRDRLREASLPADGAESGRGLYILARLADAVSVEGGSVQLVVRRRE